MGLSCVLDHGPVLVRFMPWSRTLLTLSLLGCSSSGPDIRIGAAASLSDVLPSLLESAEVELGLDIEAVYASSGELAAQLRHGAQLDALFLASEPRIAELISEGILVESEGPSLRNQLVLAGPSGGGSGDLVTQLATSPRVGIGTLGVPAGDYARTWLASEELDSVGLVEFGHVRAVLACIESGSCTQGFVYTTDLRGRAGLEVRARWSGSPRYAYAISPTASQGPAQLGLLLAESRSAFADAGFLVEEL